MTCRPRSIFVIHAQLFFMDIPATWFNTTSEDRCDVPWSIWGPQNSRCFPLDLETRPLHDGIGSIFGVGGSRVIRLVDTRMHMADFNPSAVARGIGNVVRVPTTIPTRRPPYRYSFTEDVTTYLPYVEVVNNDRDFDGSLWDIVLDDEKVLIFTRTNTATVSVFLPVKLMKITTSLNRSK
jgi:hypothetical protein